MSDCDHHYHVTWLDKFSESIQCCHCGDELEQGEFNYMKPPSCGDKARSRPSALFPVHDYVAVVPRGDD